MPKDENSNSGGRPLTEGVAQIHREGGGAVRIGIIRPEDIFALSCAVFDGDARALAYLSAAAQGSERIRKQAQKEPALCLCCPRSIRDPHATLAILEPAADAATVIICSAICAKCSDGTTDEILARAAAAYEKFLPGLRCVKISHPEGGTA